MLDAWREWERQAIACIAEPWGLSSPRVLDRKPKAPPLW